MSHYLHREEGLTLRPVTHHCLSWFLDAHPEYGFVCGASEGKGEFRSAEFAKDPLGILGRGILVRDEVMKKMGERVGKKALPESSEELILWLAGAISEGWKGAYVAMDFRDTYPEPQAIRRGQDEELSRLIFAEHVMNHEANWTDAQGRPKHQCFAKVPTQVGPTPSASEKNDAPKLLMLLPHFAMGGSDKFNLDLARTLKKEHGYELAFISTLSKEDAWERQFRELSEELYPLQSFLIRPHFPRFIASYINGQKIEKVLLSHSTLAYQCLPFLREQCPDTVFIDYLHMEEEGWREDGYPSLSRQYSAYLDKTLVSSEHLEEWMKDRGSASEQLQVLRTNIDPQLWDPIRYDAQKLRAAWGIAEGECLIAFAGRLTAQKQPRLLIEVMLELEERELPFQCLVAGAGQDREYLERFIERYEMSSTRLLGLLEPEQMRELMAAADIFFIPSAYEGIALANYEALAMECAVVGSRVGGQEELLSEDCSILLDPEEGSAEAYANILEKLIIQKDHRRELGAAGRFRIVENFSLQDMGESFASLLGSIARKDSPQLDSDFRQTHLEEVIEQFRLEQELYRVKSKDGDMDSLHNLYEGKMRKIREQLLKKEAELAAQREPDNKVLKAFRFFGRS